ncbi:MAG: hypothetical protein JXA78_16040 [Anaerolineales bacterium]|nr:hypothetical protein [Anaerolineales bacterium]
METFTPLKDLIPNLRFAEQRQQALDGLDLKFIDAPLVGLIKNLARLPYCFSLQCCYGHFLYNGQRDERHIGRLPRGAAISEVDYRIAYLAICLQDNDEGRALFEEFGGMTAIDPAYVQFGCADWFWEQQVNSYALQVEPERFKDRDRALVGYAEALRIERVRDEFFERLGTLIEGKLL